ncbi:hypothetical protein GCM10027075_00640 [Streptomyces heilongjiangensis]
MHEQPYERGEQDDRDGRGGGVEQRVEQIGETRDKVGEYGHGWEPSRGLVVPGVVRNSPVSGVSGDGDLGATARVRGTGWCEEGVVCPTR